MKRIFAMILCASLLLGACASPTPLAERPLETDSPLFAAPEKATPEPGDALFAANETPEPTPEGTSRPRATAMRFKSPTPTPTNAADALAFQRAALLGRGVNFGNALEAPNEGDWGVTLRPEYFKLIKETGFQTVRVPTNWAAHALEKEPYTIAPAFFKRIDWVLEQAAANDLNVILNIHHYDGIMWDPANHRPRYLSLWKQIAEHYADAPDTVYFELLNEPTNAVDPQFLNQLYAEVIGVIRESNPTRTLILGPTWWNAVDHLSELRLPESERNLIVTFHYYWPIEFTHQGAEWMGGSDQWIGMDWGTSADKDQLAGHLRMAARWAEQNHRPLLLGEFGVYNKAPIEARVRYTTFVAREAEKLGIAWAYWDFSAGFGIYDPAKGVFLTELVEALIPVP